MNYDPKKPLVFQHIPKCAGTSVRRVFSRWFGDNLYTHYFDNRLSAPPEKIDLDEAQEKASSQGGSVCIFGHFNREKGYGYGDYYPNVSQIVTIVRDPFEHHLSNYYFAKRKVASGRNELPLAKLIVEQNLSIEEYLHGHRSYLLSFFPAELNERNYREKLREEYVFIGITEHLSDSIYSLAGLLGKPHLRVPRENVSSRSDEAAIAHYRRVFEVENEFVTEVFGECCRIFKERKRRSFLERMLSKISKG